MRSSYLVEIHVGSVALGAFLGCVTAIAAVIYWPWEPMPLPRLYGGHGLHVGVDALGNPALCNADGQSMGIGEDGGLFIKVKPTWVPGSLVSISCRPASGRAPG